MIASVVVDRVALARAVAAAVAAVPGVARLSAGAGVEVATLYPGGKVVGVVVADSAVTVHLVADELPLDALLTRVRTAVAAVTVSVGAALAVDLVVEDLALDHLPPRSRAAGRIDRAGRPAARRTAGARRR